MLITKGVVRVGPRLRGMIPQSIGTWVREGISFVLYILYLLCHSEPTYNLVVIRVSRVTRIAPDPQAGEP